MAVESAGRPPVGMVAMLFTDIEGSTRLASELGPGWAGVLAEHHGLVGGAIADAGGFVDRTEGDAFFATFSDPVAAARAAVAAQRALRAHEWPEAVGELRVRMGLHVGQVQRTEVGYVGLEVHRAARVVAAAHGGELLLTAAARELAGEELVTESVGVHRLKDFPAPVQLFCAEVDGRGAAFFPPPRTESVRPTNLLAGGVPLVGRDAELVEIVDALACDDERFVTITGRGGAGKTSLALLAGNQLLDGHPGGVWWVDLTAVGSPDEVPPAIAAVVGADPEPESSVEAAITTRLRHSGATLVIVDNFEHVRTVVTTLCDLLSRLPDLRLLVTSRVPLRVDFERVIALDGLDERSALELIERSLGRRGSKLVVSDPEDEALREVVRLLDGLPLALELAAARLSLLTPGQLRDRLRESIDVLGKARGEKPARHRSLRAVLESTLSLLDRGPRALFVRMGAFAGPAELEELEQVLSGDGVSVLEALAQLMDAALVKRVETGDGFVRFGLPEAFRQIALDMLDNAPDGKHWRHAHAQRQFELAWTMRGRCVDRKTHLAASAAERDLEAALRWATASHDPLEQPLAAANASMLLERGRTREAGALIERLIASPPAGAEARWLSLDIRASYLFGTGRFDEARDMAEEAYRAAPNGKSRCLSMILRGLGNLMAGDTPEALNDHAEATALARELTNDPFVLVGALMMEAQAMTEAGLLNEAVLRLDEAREVGGPIDALALRRLDTHLGDLALADGRPADALEPYARSMEIALADRAPGQIVFDMNGVANALARLGRYADSLEVTGIAEALSAETGIAFSPLDLAGEVSTVERRLGPAAAAEIKERGRTVDPAERVARACKIARSHAPAHATTHE